jgi:sulfate adenylyltransferase
VNTFIGRMRPGCTVFLTGLPASGKSTLANALVSKFVDLGEGPVTLLDGDVARKQMSPDLGFSKQDRDINVRRIGQAALDVTRNGGLAVCAPIAPYADVRDEVRRMIAPIGGFVLVYVATPLHVCEARDPKGLYARARAGLLEHFTGISDPYEPPDAPDVVVDTSYTSPDEATRQILLFMDRSGLLRGSARRFLPL